MDFELSAQQEQFRRVIRDFVHREIRPVVHEWEHEGKYPTEIAELMEEMGLFGMTVPVDHGGLGLDMVSVAIVFEEISKGWMGIAGILGSHSLACFMIARHGTAEQKERFLADLASGHRRTGIGLTSQAPAAICKALRRGRLETATTTSCRARRCGSPMPATRIRSQSW